MLRPEQLTVRSDGAGENPVGVPARVGAVEYFGHDCVITAVLLDTSAEPVTVTCRTTGTTPMRPGTRVRITVSGAGLIFPEPGQAGSTPDPNVRAGSLRRVRHALSAIQ